MSRRRLGGQVRSHQPLADWGAESQGNLEVQNSPGENVAKMSRGRSATKGSEVAGGDQ